MVDFVVVGGQKAGSTVLQWSLAEHPEIYMPAGEHAVFEAPDYSAKAVDELAATQLRRGRGRVVGIKRPTYLCRPEVPGNVLRSWPEVKVLAILRDPIDRAVSAYFHYIRDGFLPPVPVEVGLAAVLDGRPTGPRGHDILLHSRYGAGLARWFELIPRERLWITTIDDLRREGPGVMADAYRFLGVEPSFVPAELTRHRMSGQYDLARLQWWWRLRHVLRRYSDDGTRMTPRSRLLLGVAARVMDLQWGGEVATKPSLSAELTHRLRGALDEDVARVESLLGRDLSGWRSA